MKPPGSPTGATHIFRTLGLQIESPSHQIVQDGKHTLSLQTALQTCQKFQVKLDAPPLAQPNLVPDGRGQLGQQVIHHAAGRLRDLGPAVRQSVHDQHHGSDEWSLEGLLDDELEHELDEVAAQALIVIVVSQKLRNGLDLFVAATEGRFGELQDLFADANWDGGFVSSSGSTSVVGIIVIWREV